MSGESRAQRYHDDQYPTTPPGSDAAIRCRFCRSGSRWWKGVPALALRVVGAAQRRCLRPPAWLFAFRAWSVLGNQRRLWRVLHKRWPELVAARQSPCGRVRDGAVAPVPRTPPPPPPPTPRCTAPGVLQYGCRYRRRHRSSTIRLRKERLSWKLPEGAFQLGRAANPILPNKPFQREGSPPGAAPSRGRRRAQTAMRQEALAQRRPGRNSSSAAAAAAGPFSRASTATLRSRSAARPAGGRTGRGGGWPACAVSASGGGGGAGLAAAAQSLPCLLPPPPPLPGLRLPTSRAVARRIRSGEGPLGPLPY